MILASSSSSNPGPRPRAGPTRGQLRPGCAVDLEHVTPRLRLGQMQGPHLLRRSWSPPSVVVVMVMACWFDRSGTVTPMGPLAIEEHESVDHVSVGSVGSVGSMNVYPLLIEYEPRTLSLTHPFFLLQFFRGSHDRYYRRRRHPRNRPQHEERKER
jgi:hypothetical protein